MTTSLAIDQQQEALLKIRDFGLAVIELKRRDNRFHKNLSPGLCRWLW